MIDKPLVSIGVPVYNGERFLSQALDTLLAQDYENLELIISDNDSTDRTQEICLDYAARDKRVRYYRNEANLGASKNFNRVFELSKGEYFMWAGADDYRASTFVSRCLNVLLKDPAVVLAFSIAVEIDSQGQSQGPMKGLVDTTEVPTNALWRFNAFMWGYMNCSAVYGLIRSEALRKTKLIRNMISPDVLVMLELSLLGSFAVISEPLFYRRVLASEQTGDDDVTRWLVDIDPRNKDREQLFPFWRFAASIPLTVLRAPVGLGTKVMLLPSAFLLLPFRYGYLLKRDLRNARKAVLLKLHRKSGSFKT